MLITDAPEAVEIAKLRLFLKLVAQISDPSEVEPLPDLDFNIKAGNLLDRSGKHRFDADRITGVRRFLSTQRSPKQPLRPQHAGDRIIGSSLRRPGSRWPRIWQDEDGRQRLVSIGFEEAREVVDPALHRTAQHFSVSRRIGGRPTICVTVSTWFAEHFPKCGKFGTGGFDP